MQAADVLHSPISISKKTIAPKQSSLLKHAYYEIIFIASGSGSHYNHKVHTSFSKGDVFFVQPKDEHAFTITHTAEVFFIRFTEETKINVKALIQNSKGRATPPLKSKSPINLKISLGKEDIDIMNQLCLFLIALAKDVHKNIDVLYYQMVCLISIMERNLSYAPHQPSKISSKESIRLILKHIQKNLKDPELLSLQYLAKKFNCTPNQLGIYFKKEVGNSVKQYILECRMEVIEKKVKHGEQTFSEIASEFNFVDESHFYKSFKRHFGSSPTQYRSLS